MFSELVESVLDGLTKFAIETDDSYLRSEAIGFLSVASMPEGPGKDIVTRLERIYDAVEDYSARSQIVVRLGYQHERAAAARLLERIASKPPDPRWSEPLPALAVRSLERLGAEGEASLEALRRSGIVKPQSEISGP